MLLKTFKELGKHSLIYGLGWFASSLASILLLPLYTRFLTRTDYGILEMIDSMRGILIILMLAGFVPAMARFYHSASSASERKAVVSTAIWVTLFSATIWGVVSLVNDTYLAIWILGNKNMAFYIDVGLAILFFEVLYIVTSNYFNLEKSVVFVSFSLFKLILNIAANIVFVVVFELGAKGMLYGSLLSGSVVCMIITVYCFYLNGIRIDFRLLLSMTKFGIPFVPSILCAFLIHNADRYLLQNYMSLSVVGIYGLGYKLPFMLNTVIIGSFGLIWNSAVIYDISKNKDAAYQYARITTYFVTIFVVAQYFLFVTAPIVVKLLMAPDYHDAYRVTQVVSIGMCFYCLHSFFTTGAFIKDKTWFLPFSYFTSALINVLLNWWLIPKYGYLAAAWNSVITYFVFSCVGFFVFRSIYSIPFEFDRLFFLFFSVLCLGFLCYFVRFDNWTVECLKEITFIILLPGVLLLGPYLKDSERRKLADGMAKARLAFAKVRLSQDGLG